MNTKNILLLLAIYLFTQQSNRQTQYTQPPQEPYVPQHQSPAQIPNWVQWAQLIISLYGNVAELWEPGGPFYGKEQDVIDATGYTPPSNNPYDPFDGIFNV